MKQNVRKLGELDAVLKKVEDPENADMIQVLTKEKIKEIDFKLKNHQELDRIIEKSNEETEMSDKSVEGSKDEPLRPEDNSLEGDSDFSDENIEKQMASTNPMSGAKMGFQEIRTLLPQNFAIVQNIQQGSDSDESLLNDSSDGENVRISEAMQGTKATFGDGNFLQRVNQPSSPTLDQGNLTFQNKYTTKLIDSDHNVNKSAASIKSRKDGFKL